MEIYCARIYPFAWLPLDAATQKLKAVIGDGKSSGR
jgi:hypothetical protein